MQENWLPNTHLILRWLHILAGITWIGHLYFFNFVNSQLQPKLDGATKKLVNPQLMPRALWWFRWGAMITMLTGLGLFSILYMYNGETWGPAAGMWGAFEGGGLSDRALWILIGMVLGLIMWFNVWFIIWPAQKKIISAVAAGTPPDAALVKKATLASKINTYLSAPMLFGMVGAPHYSSIDPVIAGICIAIAGGAIHLAYRGAKTAGSSI